MKGRSWKRLSCTASTSWNWKQFWVVKERFKTGYRGDIWIVNPKGNIVASGYKWLKEQHPEVTWHQWVWNKFSIPRHKLICWIILWRRIRAIAKLVRFGLLEDVICPE